MLKSILVGPIVCVIFSDQQSWVITNSVTCQNCRSWYIRPAIHKCTANILFGTCKKSAYYFDWRFRFNLVTFWSDTFTHAPISYILLMHQNPISYCIGTINRKRILFKLKTPLESETWEILEIEKKTPAPFRNDCLDIWCHNVSKAQSYSNAWSNHARNAMTS